MTEEKDLNTTYSSRLFLLAGLSSIIIAIGYVIITIEYVISGVPLPDNAIAWISYLDGKSILWWSIIWISIITNILYLPVAFGLFELFKVKQKLIILSSLFLFSLFVILELALTWSKYPALLNIVNKYLAESNIDLQKIYLSTIEGLTSEFTTSVTVFYTIFIPSIAVILASVAMIKDKRINKIVSIVGLVSGSCNACSVVGGYFIPLLGQLVVLGSFLQLFWFLGIGIKLIQFRKHNLVI